MRNLGTKTKEEEAIQAILDRIGGGAAAAVAEDVPTVVSRRAASRVQRVDDASTVAAPALAAAGPRPWMVASASLVVWGGGQWLNRQRSLAVLFVLLEALAVAWGWSLRESWQSWVWLGNIFFINEVTLQTWVALAGLVFPAIGIGCVLHAYLGAERHVGGRPFGGPAVVPPMFSVLLPGWGQILNGQLGKAILFLSTWTYGLYVVAASQVQPGMWNHLDPSRLSIAGLRLSTGTLVAAMLSALVWVLSLYDATLTARNHARE